MMPTFPYRLLLALVALALVTDGRADSFRCGRKVVRSGDTAADVERVCGVPKRKDSGTEAVSIDGSRQSVRVERWYYKNSRRSLGRIVMLYRGRVVAIETGER